MIEFAEIDIGEVLAGQVADGQTFAGDAAGRRMINNQIQYSQKPGVLDDAAQQPLQGGMINIVEIFSNIAFEEVSILPRIFLRPQNGGMAALAGAAGPAIVYQPSVEDRPDNIADGVVQHAVAKISGADAPGLGLTDFEDAKLSWPPCSASQFFLKFKQLLFQMKQEVGDAHSVFLVAGGLF